MKITGLKSHVLQYDLERELGYSQQYFTKRTAHIVEVTTDEGITGLGECFGPGPVAGIWAIAMRSIGFMGKLIAEAIEEIDHGPVEAIEATGAGRLKVLWIAVLPQVLPEFTSTGRPVGCCLEAYGRPPLR